MFYGSHFDPESGRMLKFTITICPPGRVGQKPIAEVGKSWNIHHLPSDRALECCRFPCVVAQCKVWCSDASALACGTVVVVSQFTSYYSIDPHSKVGQNLWFRGAEGRKGTREQFIKVHERIIKGAFNHL